MIDRQTALRALLLDFDGVIGDTEALHFETFRDTLLAAGIGIADTDGTRFLGHNDWVCFEMVLREEGCAYSGEDVDRLVADKAVRHRAALPGVDLCPGAENVIREAAVRQIPCAVVSGSLREDILIVLRAHGLADAIHCIVAADDGIPSKPAPDGFLRAFEASRRLVAGLRREECLVVEDSPPGIEAARAARIPSLAVAHSFPAAALGAADYVLPGLVDWSWERFGG